MNKYLPVLLTFGLLSCQAYSNPPNEVPNHAYLIFAFFIPGSIFAACAGTASAIRDKLPTLPPAEYPRAVKNLKIARWLSALSGIPALVILGVFIYYDLKWEHGNRAREQILKLARGM